MKSIEIIIDESGEIKLETNGYKGEDCIDILEKLEQAIGKNEHTEDKPDRFQNEQIYNKQKY